MYLTDCIVLSDMLSKPRTQIVFGGAGCIVCAARKPFELSIDQEANLLPPIGNY